MVENEEIMRWRTGNEMLLNGITYLTDTSSLFVVLGAPVWYTLGFGQTDRKVKRFTLISPGRKTVRMALYNELNANKRFDFHLGESAIRSCFRRNCTGQSSGH